MQLRKLLGITAAVLLIGPTGAYAQADPESFTGDFTITLTQPGSNSGASLQTGTGTSALSFTEYLNSTSTEIGPEASPPNSPSSFSTDALTLNGQGTNEDGTLMASWFVLDNAQTNDQVTLSVTDIAGTGTAGDLTELGCTDNCTNTLTVDAGGHLGDPTFFVGLSNGDYLELDFTDSDGPITEDLNVKYTTTPEPASLTLFSAALVGLGVLRRRARRGRRA
jgi:hypothetical protein